MLNKGTRQTSETERNTPPQGKSGGPFPAGDAKASMPKAKKFDVRYAECPFYLDQDGRWWNRWYRLITESQNFSRTRDISSYIDEIQDVVKYIRSNPRPDPMSFKKYFGYEQALMSWKAGIENKLSGLRVKLPVPVSRYYSRPRFLALGGTEPVAGGEKFRETAGLLTARQRGGDKKAEERPEAGSAEGRREVAVWKRSEKRGSSSGSRDAGWRSRLWGATFVPMEPNPEDFGTYKSYEDAMRRWASVVQGQRDLPPHALEIADVLVIASPYASRSTQEEGEAEDRVLSDPVSCWSNPMEVAFFDAEVDAGLLERPLGYAEYGGGVSRRAPSFVSVTQTMRSQFDSALSGLIANGVSNRAAHGAYSPQVLGELPAPLLRTAFYGAFTRSSEDWRRAKMGEGCAGPEGFAKWVRSRIFSPINYRTLVSDADYQNRLCGEMQMLHALLVPLPIAPHGRVDASVNPEYLEIFSFLSKNQKNLNYERVLSVFRSGLKLDEFMNILNASVDAEGNRCIEIYTLISSCLCGGDLRRLLDFFKCSHSELLHAKVAYFFCAVSNRRFVGEFVRDLADGGELEMLSMVAYALTYFQPVAIDLFPYRAEVMELACRLIGEVHRGAVEQVLVSYYVDLCEHGVYLPIDRATRVRKMPSTGIPQSARGGLRSYSREFLWGLFEGMACGARSVALLFLFLTTRVLRQAHENARLRNALFAPPKSVLERGMMRLAASRRSHAQFAFRSIGAVLVASDARFVDYCMESIEYRGEGGSRDGAFRSLFLVRSHAPIPYLEFLLGVIKAAMRSPVVYRDIKVRMSIHRSSDSCLYPVPVLFLLSSSTLSEVFQGVVGSAECLDAATLLRARLLKLLLKFSVRLASPCHESSEEEGRDGLCALKVSRAELSQLVSFLNSTRRDVRSPIADDCKAQLLRCVQYMFRVPSFLQLVSSDDRFHKALSRLCNSPPQRLNLEAWRCFHSLLVHHHPCAQQLYEKNCLGLYFHGLKTMHNMALMQNMFECIYALLVPLRKKRPKSNWHHHFYHARADLADKSLGVAKVIHHYFVESDSYAQLYSIFQRLSAQKFGSAYAYLSRIYYVLCYRQPAHKSVKAPPSFHELINCTYWKYQEKEITNHVSNLP